MVVTLARRIARPFVDDIRSDPLLRYILLLGVFSFGIGIWLRVPNFVGADEYSRLIQPMKIAGRVVADPGVDSFRRAATDGRALGASVYLHGLVLAPIFVAILLSGSLDTFVGLGSIDSRWTLWQEVPAWFWTSSILLGRLVSLTLGIGCVYLVYRLGRRIRNLWTGRVAAVGLTLSMGFVESAHTANEDIPMVFLLLLTLWLCLRYVDSGSSRAFLAACFTAGLAVGFKLTGGSAVVLVGVSYLLRARTEPNPIAALARPKLLSAGLVVGFVTIYVGFPSVIATGPEALLTRVLQTTGEKTSFPGGVPAGIEYWLLKGYLGSFGIPLFIWVLAGLAATIRSVTDGAETGLTLVATPVAVTLLVFATWRYVRIHHLLPTLPFLLLLGAVGMDRLRRNYRRSVRLALTLLLVSSAVFTAVGDFRIAADPRDQGTEWLRANAAPDETVEVYEDSVADVAAVHGRPITHFDYREENGTYGNSIVRDQRAYTEWMLSMPERKPEYIQLTGSELQYIRQGHPDAEQYPRRGDYIRGLLNASYEYRVVAQFGERATVRSSRRTLLYEGIVPPLESREETVIILARTDIKVEDAEVSGRELVNSRRAAPCIGPSQPRNCTGT